MIYITCLQTRFYKRKERFTKGKQYEVIEWSENNKNKPVVMDNFGAKKTIHLDKGEWL